MSLATLWIGQAAADEALLAHVDRRLEQALECPVQRMPGRRAPEDTFDQRRGQHSSAAMLRWLAGLVAEPRLVAFTDVDLFIPVLTFVFGEAQLGGPAAVVSTARLGTGPALAARLGKEAVHEAGHTWGLLHCDAPRCAMRRSAGLPDVDAKSDELCRDCRSRLHDARGQGK